MGRQIVVAWEGRESSFEFAKLTRDKLYGHKERRAVDPSGRPCTRAALTQDGSLLLRPGMTAQGYFTGGGRWVPIGELVGMSEGGDPLPKLPSTLGSPQPLEGPLPPTALLDLRVGSVYLLEPEALDEELRERLQERGELFRFPFSYRGGWKEDTAFLVGNAEGVFALVGQATTPDWCELESAPAADWDEDEDDWGLDFDML